MNRFAWVVMAVVLVALAAGCKDKAASSTAAGSGSPVAVVDFTMLQLNLGVAPQVQNYLKTAEEDLNKKLNERIKPLQEEAQKLQADAGKAVRLMPEDKRDDPEALKNNKALQEILEKVRSKDIEARQIQRDYQKLWDKYKQSLDDVWRAAIDPAVTKVASENGFKVVIAKSGVVHSAAEVNITDKVEEQVKKSGGVQIKAPPTNWDEPK